MAATATTTTALLSISNACDSMLKLKLIHARLIRFDLHHHRILAKLFRFAAVSPAGDLHYATLLFSYHHCIRSTNTTAFFYNTLIRGFANSSDPSQSFTLFNSMCRRSISPDPFSFTFILKARSRCLSNMAGDVQAQALKFGCLGPHPSHANVHNALIHLYALADPGPAQQVFDEMPEPDVVSWSGLLSAHLRVSDLDNARKVFDGMPERDVVSWTAMISGYTRAQRARDALKLFQLMPMQPDEVTMVAVISACTALGDLEAGEGIHRYINDKCFGWMVSLCNALIDMYAKCGCLKSAREVFDETKNKSLTTWNSMISAYAAHGASDAAIKLFDEMSAAGVKPDGVSFLAVLSACTHQGRVSEGRRLFAAMPDNHVAVGVEHYGCMVDMLGRAGLLEEAYQLIESMPMPSNDVIWGALLGACNIHGNVRIAEKAVEKVMQLKSGKGGYYVILSNMYAASGRRAEASKMRQNMEQMGARKTPGISSSWASTPCQAINHR
ncbi:TPR-like protein [Dioscorea alata]|uniref:TPR-like protein n=1 Tax=Dioscorea alata TaxID=55571 RepID=A0ACB7W7N3_DIOAL|nr:TPR-like protein [Dioscorea alata]